jgi:DNA-binding response OmpR family regulator
MMTVLMETSGIDVTCVQGMTDVLQLPNKDRFDLFLLDLWLNDGDGNDLCARLRNDFPDIPVVFYTGCATERERKEGIVSGAAAYLVKPYSELIAPMVFKLVTGADPTKLLDAAVDPFMILESRAKHLLTIVRGSGGLAPLSPHN